MINEDIYKYMTPGSKQSVWQNPTIAIPICSRAGGV